MGHGIIVALFYGRKKASRRWSIENHSFPVNPIFSNLLQRLAECKQLRGVA